MIAGNTIRNKVIQNAKNIIGWKSNRKIVVFSVDDYGNVRLDSSKARAAMDKDGMKVLSRFDAYDALETREDLEMLFDVLASVNDKNGHHAVFTPFALPCNIDFETMAEMGNQEYVYEKLPETFNKLSAVQPSAYNGVWNLWKEGINKGLLAPQFHGREHLNIKYLEQNLKDRSPYVLTALENRSYASIPHDKKKNISPMAAFDFWEFNENEFFIDIIRDGLDAFENVYGYKSVHFNPPAGREHNILHQVLHENGIKYIDTPLIKREHQGKGIYKKSVNYTGKKNKLDQIFLVRNVVFEPTEERNLDWVSFAMNQIESAFRWNRPAIISSHRVNFCGHIDPRNRQTGIVALKNLLLKITTKWPAVEFLSANKLGELISIDENKHEY